MAEISLARKKELKEPDEIEVFLKNLLEKALQYKKELTIGLVVFFSVMLLGSGLFYHTRNKETKASLMLAQLVSSYDTAQASSGVSQELMNDFKDFLDTYSGTAAANFATIRYGNICYRQKKYDDAISIFKDALSEFKQDPAMKNIITSNLAYAYNEKQDYDNALKYFEEIAAEENGLLKADALFNLGLIYAHMDDNAKSRESFEKIASFAKGSPYLDIVKEKLGK